MSVYNKRKIIYCKDTNETVTGEQYLNSKHWRILRKKIYDKYNGKCKKCHKTFDSQHMNVHHLTYKRIGKEKESDLVLLCEKCHSKIHDEKNKKKIVSEYTVLKNQLKSEDMRIYEIYLLLKTTDLDWNSISHRYNVPLSTISQIASKKGKYGQIIRNFEKDNT